MAKLTFSGGIHPYDGKDMSKDIPIKAVYPVSDLVYPLSQHIGAPAKPVVKTTSFPFISQPQRDNVIMPSSIKLQTDLNAFFIKNTLF